MLAVVMKMAKQSGLVSGHRLRVWLIVGSVLLCAPVALRAINVVAPATDADNQGAAAATATRFSPGVADIVKLVQAKVDPEVIRTFIKSSPTAYNPTATEIIALKDQGVSPEILTAILQRGAEVRAQSMQVAPAAQQVNPQVVPPYAPAYDYGTQPAYPSYPYSYPVSSYAYPSYGYAYPGYDYGYSDYGYGWPYSWPSYYFGLGGYCYRNPYYCGWRGGYGGAFYGRGYYGGRGYYQNRGYYGGRGYYSGSRGFSGNRSRPVSFVGSRGGFRSIGGGARSTGFASRGGGFRSGGGFSGHASSFGGRGGGFGGHGGGRGR